MSFVSDLDLCYLPGHQALRLFENGELSPVDVLEAQIKRAEAVNPVINAITDSYYDEALDQARAAERLYAGKSKNPRPLEGLTLSVKDHQDLIGKRTTQASLPYQDTIATRNSAANERLLAAGAIVVAKTTTPEFCSAGVTYSKLFGITGTPWDPDFTAGGSSGGSGASLGAGMTTLATGSDIAGSIRVPAACCGVVGYKPPYGRIPAASPGNLDFFSQTGPLARTVGDCALMMNVMAGYHPEDIATLREEINLPLNYENISGWSIAYSTDLGFSTIAPEVLENFMNTVSMLRDLGATVEEVKLSWTSRVTDVAASYLDHLFGRELARAYQEHGEQLCDYNIFYAKRAENTDADALLRAYQTTNDMYRELAPILDRHDAFICPTLASHEVKADAKPWETININGKDIITDFDWVLTHPFNMLSRLPVLAIPNGMGGNGLPTSIQIVARSFDDHRVFQLASALEKAAPWLDCDDRRPMTGEEWR